MTQSDLLQLLHDIKQFDIQNLALDLPHDIRARIERALVGWDAIVIAGNHEAPFTCKYCGSPSWIDPSDQSPPPDYCHEIDHGTTEDRAVFDAPSLES